MEDFEQLLNENLPQIDYVNDLANAFMDKWDRFRLKRRPGRARP